MTLKPRNLTEWIALLAPFAMLFEIVVIGRLFLLEVIFALVAVPLYLERHKRQPFSQELKLIFALLVAWLLAQVVSDVYQHSAFTDYSRGWAKIAFTGLDLLVLYLFLDDHRKLLYFYLGLSITSALMGQREFEDLATIWKFGLGNLCLDAALFLILMHHFREQERYAYHGFFHDEYLVTRSLRRVAFALLGFALLCLYFNTRGGAGGSTVTAALILALAVPSVRAGMRTIGTSRGILLLAVILSVSYLIVYVYIDLASGGYLGEAAQDKLAINMLGEHSVLGFITGGRREVLVAIHAIKQSPFIGYGSWAKNTQLAELLAYISIYEGTYESSHFFSSVTSDLIPSHSTLFGAWMEAGIFGAFFWGFILFLAVRRMRSAAECRDATDFLLLALSLGLLSSMMFSPFGAEQRMAWALRIVIILGGAWRLSRGASSPDPGSQAVPHAWQQRFWRS